jgi:hypothetical protein
MPQKPHTRTNGWCVPTLQPVLLPTLSMTTPTLPNLPIFHTIAEAAQALGQPAYVIGGYVRDLALQRGSKDIDVVTVGDGIAGRGPQAAGPGPRHGIQKLWYRHAAHRRGGRN